MSQLMGTVNRTRRMWLGLRRAWLLQTVTFTMLASYQLANLGTWLMWLFFFNFGALFPQPELFLAPADWCKR
jgi:hypothetical protein